MKLFTLAIVPSILAGLSPILARTMTLSSRTNPRRAPQPINTANNRYVGVLAGPPSPGPDNYKSFKGDGSVKDGWPDQTQWLSFNMLWFLNEHAFISKLCDNTASETHALLQAITSTSQHTGVDARLILAVIITESHGCVRVPSTSLSVSNPGLMQAYGPHANGSCAEPTLLKPCPAAQIERMVLDGTDSNPAGVNLKDLIVTANASDVSRYYKAVRMYNSGPLSIHEDGDLSGRPAANACYASDLANRLLGYLGESCGGTEEYNKINAS